MNKIIRKLRFLIMALGLSFVFQSSVNAATSLDGFIYSVNEDTKEATITGYTGTEINLIIPKSIDGYKITSIGVDSFNGNKTIQTVTIPSSVKTIKEFAFFQCKKLKRSNNRRGM